MAKTTKEKLQDNKCPKCGTTMEDRPSRPSFDSIGDVMGYYGGGGSMMEDYWQGINRKCPKCHHCE